MTRWLLTAGQILTERGSLTQGAVLCEFGHIVDVLDEVPAEGDFRHVDAPHCTLAPGFIDLHIHGADGFDTMDASREALEHIASYLATTGTTGFLATTMTASQESTLAALAAVREFMARPGSGASLLGVHLEGPFINPVNKGAQNGEYVRTPSPDELEEYLHALPGGIRLLTLAPELDAGFRTISRAVAAGITVSAGHSACTYETALAAIDGGVTHATHLFNGMDPLHHRRPGLVAAVLHDPRVRAELIVDGIHVHAGAIRLALAAKGHNGLVLITDCMRAGNLPDGDYGLGGLQVQVQAGVARLPEGNLAGSTLRMNEAVQRMRTVCNLPLVDAVRMATLNPASIIGIEERKGSIAKGKDADFVWLDGEGRVAATMVAGAWAYRSQSFESS